MKKYILKPRTEETPGEVDSRKFRIDYQNQLNPAQYKAVSSVNGPHLVIAGAGTGKTRTITYRVAYLVELGVKPESILLLTFTRRAAQEMLRRAATLLDTRCERVAGGTFHSFANLVLRKYASALGLESSFTILDQSDAEDVVNLLRTQMRFDAKERRFPRKQTLYAVFSKSVNTLKSIPDILREDYPHYEDLAAEFMQLYTGYCQYKKKHSLLDYDDLQVSLCTLLREKEGIQQKLAGIYKYIMVDEYQDTNSLQADIVQLLGKAHGNVMVVGDDAQSIYSFRGATIRNILDFPEHYPGCTIITLEENYRSTQPILRLTNEILKRARD
jgi:DNA helicase-2/ATP-dependent DNA helicase PcrA